MSNYAYICNGGSDSEPCLKVGFITSLQNHWVESHTAAAIPPASIETHVNTKHGKSPELKETLRLQLKTIIENSNIRRKDNRGEHYRSRETSIAEAKVEFSKNKDLKAAFGTSLGGLLGIIPDLPESNPPEVSQRKERTEADGDSSRATVNNSGEAESDSVMTRNSTRQRQSNHRLGDSRRFKQDPGSDAQSPSLTRYPGPIPNSPSAGAAFASGVPVYNKRPYSAMSQGSTTTVMRNARIALEATSRSGWEPNSEAPKYSSSRFSPPSSEASSRVQYTPAMNDGMSNPVKIIIASSGQPLAMGPGSSVGFGSPDGVRGPDYCGRGNQSIASGRLSQRARYNPAVPTINWQPVTNPSFGSETMFSGINGQSQFSPSQNAPSFRTANGSGHSEVGGDPRVLPERSHQGFAPTPLPVQSSAVLILPGTPATFPQSEAASNVHQGGSYTVPQGGSFPPMSCPAESVPPTSQYPNASANGFNTQSTLSTDIMPADQDGAARSTQITSFLELPRHLTLEEAKEVGRLLRLDWE